MTDAERYAHFSGEGPHDGPAPTPTGRQLVFRCRECHAAYYQYRKICRHCGNVVELSDK